MSESPSISPVVVTLPDGSKRNFAAPLTGAQLAASIGPGLAKAAIALKLDGRSRDLATLIDRAGVAVRAGTHCAMPLLQRFGLTSTCRASFGLYNTRAEIDALADALVRAGKLFV